MVFNEIKKLDTSVDVKTRSRYSEMVFNKETRYKCRCQNEITVLGNGFNNKETGYKCRCQNEITVLGNGF